MTNYVQTISFIWSIADTLRGNYRQSEYGKVILPFTILRRLDCLLEPTKDTVIAKIGNFPPNMAVKLREEILNEASGYAFHNTSHYTLKTLLNEPDQITVNFNNMLNGFSSDVRELFIGYFDLPQQIARLDDENLLYLITKQFVTIDLHPTAVPFQ